MIFSYLVPVKVEKLVFLDGSKKRIPRAEFHEIFSDFVECEMT
jgi:hypothetical protein